MIIYVNLCALCSVRFLNFHFLVLINTSFIPTNFSNLLSVEISKNIKIIYRIDNFWMWHKNQKDPTQNLVDEEIILFSCYYMYVPRPKCTLQNYDKTNDVVFILQHNYVKCY